QRRRAGGLQPAAQILLQPAEGRFQGDVVAGGRQLPQLVEQRAGVAQHQRPPVLRGEAAHRGPLQDVIHRRHSPPPARGAGGRRRRHPETIHALALTNRSAWPILARMAAERAKTFAERLPPVVPKEEEDISQLSDEMADVLYPGRRKRPFRIGVRFDLFEGPNYPRALGLARQSPVYSETPERGTVSHYAAFEATAADTLRQLYEIVGPIPGSEGLVDGKRVPYARELWLPLFWIFLRGEG